MASDVRIGSQIPPFRGERGGKALVHAVVMTQDPADPHPPEAQQLRDEYMQYLRGLVDSITDAMTGLQAGPRRLFVAIEAFWEACYRQRDERLRLLEVAEQTQTQAHLDALAQIFTRMLEAELRACGAIRPGELAISLLSELREVSRAELFARHRLPWERRRLMGFIESRVGFPSGLSLAATPSLVVAVPRVC